LAVSPSAGTVIFARSFAGGSVVLLRPANWPKHSFGRSLQAAARRMHHNVVATALANKLTRIAWSVLYHGRGYEPRISAELA
jgi:transposase